MEKQTILYTALPNGREADGSLRLSVFVSPRLWSDNPAIALLQLGQFTDWLDWPAHVSGANWKVAFDGQAPVNATVVSAPPRSHVWTALFKTETDVVPYRFDDYMGAAIETFPSDEIHGFIAGLYGRAATDPAYGAARDLPPIETLANDPDLGGIARPSSPEPSYQPPPRPDPIDLGGKPPVWGPDPQAQSVGEPTPKPPPGGPPAGCGCGCLLLPFALLARLFPWLGKFLDQLFGASSKLGGSSAKPVGPAVKAAAAVSSAAKPVGSPPELIIAPPKLMAEPPTPKPAIAIPPITPAVPVSPHTAAFDKLAQFTQPWSSVSVPLPTAAEIEATFDFHKMISLLGDYPVLLRLLGLVVDLHVSAADAPANGDRTVQVEPGLGLTPTTGTVISPRSHCRIDAAAFRALPRPVAPEISNGMLRLDDAGRFQVIQVDVVGSGIKVRNTATNCVAFATKALRAPNMPDDAGLPALRTAGISIVRRQFEEELRGNLRRSLALQLFVAAKDNAPQSPPTGAEAPPAPTDELFAEDLVRGYRVDVFDLQSNAWHSLCRRVGHYHFLDAPAAPGGAISFSAEDEGFVQLGVAQPLTPTAQPLLRASDSLFVWDGWSLSAPRPGKSIMPDDTHAKPTNEALTKFKLETGFSAKPGSLPRLRFDYTYKLRARVCDLAGNSVLDPADAAEFAQDVPEETPGFPCARYEPVAPPAMMLRKLPVEGESVERLVVRTPAVAGEEQATERHIVPPKISQLMAEQHGKFDAGPQMDGTAAGYALAARESGSLNDAATEVKPGIWVQSAPQFQVTYLPDPSSRGALLLGLPGLPPEQIVEPTPAKIINKVPFDGPWPDPLPFRLRLLAIAAGAVPAEPKWHAATRVLTVELPEAQKAVVRVSSYLTSEDLDRQGVREWVKAQSPAALAQYDADLLAGRSWLHLPWRDVTLVHAVQKPLALPQITALVPGKNLGGHFATLTGTIGSDAASTGKVDLLADWEDPIDDVTQPAPGTLPHNAHICEVLIPEDSASTNILEGVKQQPPVHQFGDTKVHSVTYRSIATTRFREYFPASITDDPANITVADPVGVTAIIPNSARPDSPKVLYVVPTFAWSDAPAPPGVTERTRKGNGLRVYLDRPWFSSGAGELLGVVFLDKVRFTQLDEATKPFVTQWGADPIWLSAVTEEAARLQHFRGFNAKADGLSLAEIAQPVSVAGYPVEFDAARRLWFADIEMEIGESYTPFVRLALARFQPESVTGAHLSRIVRAEFAHLAPHRTASVAVNPTPTGAKVEVVVKGPTYLLSTVTQTAGFVFGEGSDRQGLAEIEALLQKRNRALGNDPDLAWDTLSTTMLTQAAGDSGTWKGLVELSEPLAPGVFRILFKEYEWYRSDFQPDIAREGKAVARRVVYAAAISLG